MLRSSATLLIPFFALWLLASAQTGDVLTYHNDSARTGQKLDEVILTTSNVAASSFGKLFTISVDGKVDAQPLYVSGVVIPVSGVHNALIVATEHDSVYAFDADNGSTLWKTSLLKAGETTADGRGCGQVAPEIGITSTPVIDRDSGPNGSVYAVAMSKDASGRYFQRLHALDLTTGAEQFGGPVDIVATYPGTGDNSSGGTVVFDPKQYKARPGLLLLRGVVYIGWSSHCDRRPYTAWLTGYNEHTLGQVSVLNLTPNGQEGSIWQSGGGPAADPGGNIYFLMANGTFDITLNSSGFPNKGDFGNAFVRVSPGSGSLNVTDYFTMSNTVSESDADQDLGSGGAMVLPSMVDSGGVVRRLAAGAGKDQTIYLVDRDNMGKFNPVTDNIYQELPTALGGQEFAMPAYFNGRIYFGGVGDVIRAYTFSQAKLPTTPSSQTSNSFGYPGTTPSISANGASNGILWAAENGSVAVLHAYDAGDLTHELYNSNMATAFRDHFGTGNKFITPTIANGKVFVGTTDSIGVFGVLPGSVKPIINSSAAAVAAVGTTFRFQITATNGPTSFGASGLPQGLQFNSNTGVIAGAPLNTGVTTVTISAANAAGSATSTLTITITAGLPQPAPRIVFRDTFGGVRLGTYPSSTLFNAGGVFSSDPVAVENAAGDTFVFARDLSNAIWGSAFSATSLTWGAWSPAGGILTGNPATTFATNGNAYVAARDQFGAAQLISYTPGGGFGSWANLGGVFATDPTIAAAADGSLYVIGKDNSQALWSGRYVPGTGFQGWQSGGGVIQGKPSAVVGTDSVVYIGARDSGNALWMARVQGNSWLGWSYGGGMSTADPQVAAAKNGIIDAVILDAGGGAWFRGYNEGSANGWQSWVSTGSVLQSVACAALAGDVYLAGRDANNDLWWYRATSNQWTWINNRGVAAGGLAAAPR